MRILLKEHQGQFEEKKSKFIACLHPVNSVEEAEAFINAKKKQYWDARHNCSAFIIGDKGEVTRCSDDGEPSGTAGRPMLELLTHHELTNVVVVVTRYFGGTLLGTGGLIRAYTEAVKLAIEDAINSKDIAMSVQGYSLKVTFDYTLLGKINRFIEDNSLIVKDTIYENTVTIILNVSSEEIENCKKGIVEASNGTAIFSEPEEILFLLAI